MPSTRNSHGEYACEMTVDEHRELAEVLNNVKGYVVLSGYASPEYDEWYRGWERVEFDATLFARSDRQRSRDKRTEVLWIKPAEREGFDSVGIEMNPEYCEIIRRRMAGMQPVQAALIG